MAIIRSLSILPALSFFLITIPGSVAADSHDGVPSAYESPHIVLEHSLRLGESDDFWNAWTGLTSSERESRGAAVEKWLTQLRSFGDTILIDGPDLPVGSFPWLIPDPTRLDQARTIGLDYLIGLANKAGLRIGLEIRPSQGALSAPEDLSGLTEMAKHLVERYDGDIDFGINTPGLADEMPFPDINGSFGITTSDWDKSSDEERKAFAEAHQVAFFTAGAGLPLSGDELAAHAEWIAALSANIAQANGEAKLWIGPLKLSEMKKSALQTLTAPIFAKSESAFAGFLVDVDLQVTDLGAEDIRTAIKILGNTISALDGENIGLIISGIQVPNAPGVSPSPWVRPCDVTVTCSPEIQSDLLIKSSIRIHGLGHGSGLAEPITLKDNENALGPLATLDSNKWDSEEPVINLAGRTWRQWNTLRQNFGSTTAEIAVPTQNVSAYILGETDNSGGRVIWYEWYREVPPGSSYSGIEKTVDLPAPVGARSAMIYEIPDDSDTSAASFSSAPSLSPIESLTVSELGTISLTLRDRIVVVSFSSETLSMETDAQGSSDALSSDVAESADVRVEESEDSEASSSSSGGCTSAGHPSSTSPYAVFILFAVMLVFRRTRNSTAL